MSLDFASELFFTKIFSSCISTDHKDVTNLISKRKRVHGLRTLGFQGERFVRTPVTIQLQFYVPVDINKIEFLPFVGRQCAKVIKLHVSNSYPLARRNDDGTELLKSKDDGDFRIASTAVLSEARRVAFVNRAYKPHPSLPALTSNDSSLVSFTNGDLGSITALRIVLINMLEGSVPSLARLNVWGKPGRACGKHLVKEIFDIFDMLEHEHRESGKHSVQMYGSAAINCDSHHKSIDDATKISSSQPDANLDQKDAVDCPTEFVDPLTCEMMRMPVLLPSGYTIDRLTLDKHVKSQSEMGNVPSDPFTGIPFTDLIKPEPNVKLKVRMDSYLLQLSKRSHTGESSHISEVKPCRTRHCISRKRGHEPREMLIIDKPRSSKIMPPHNGIVMSDGNLEGVTENWSSDGHSDELSSSLNVALAGVACSQAKRRVVIDRDQISTLHCPKCGVLMPSSSPQYRLPCGHVVCSLCTPDILRNGKVACPACLTSFESKNVCRIYK